MRIGEFVKDHLGKIFEHCESNPAELAHLMDADYSRRTFGLAWPFCADAGRISTKDHNRYWAARYVCGDKRLRVCSQWFERQREPFRSYLMSKGIAVLVAPATAPKPRPHLTPRNRNGRFGSIQIGDAQNAFIRFLL